ncbi:YcnI family copper-binding membrane protein [Jatrophihabitans lederbergiae]|uniref:YcnI family protein n=1 Tax=Jatrophihabitans lederbergiae TaxID=3075547 RepID=A0ABU2JAY1_9ACTN|nr:YcnI family protein [Jatrophihabitans sp. DSM 44399]MDT0261413.1 YcnI family protein [Jatrophihabitans sp. DSM 44399]
MSRRTVASSATLSVVTLGMLVAGTGVASAHVTVSAPGAISGGGDTLITFRVPDESDAASTVGLKLRLPIDTPIASVLVQPHPGWTSTTKQSKLSTPIKTDDGEITQAVSEIDWKADSAGTGIKPGQFDQFVVIAGQLPDAGTLIFKVVQTYSDGKTTSWIDVAAPGSTAEPEHPAPVLTLGAAQAAGSASAAPGPAGIGAAVADTSSGTASRPASKGAATAGIVLGIIGVLLGGAALATSLRRRTS